MKNRPKKSVPILLADDDQDDLDMIREALKESRLLNNLHCVNNGEELMDYLNHRGKFTDHEKNPTPGLILLDLNMPRMDGREVICELKKHVHFKHIPVVVLTTSQAEEDIYRTYDLGVNSFITKPVSFVDLVKVMKTVGEYWFEIVQLPDPEHQD